MTIRMVRVLEYEFVDDHAYSMHRQNMFLQGQGAVFESGPLGHSQVTITEVLRAVVQEPRIGEASGE